VAEVSFLTVANLICSDPANAELPTLKRTLVPPLLLIDSPEIELSGESTKITSLVSKLDVPG